MKIPFAGHCLISDVPGDKMILFCRLKIFFMFMLRTSIDMRPTFKFLFVHY